MLFGKDNYGIRSFRIAAFVHPTKPYGQSWSGYYTVRNLS